MRELANRISTTKNRDPTCRADTLAADKRREAEHLERLRKTYLFSDSHTTPRVGVGSRSPLSFTGLVLAGTPAKEGAADGPIVTGDAILRMSLKGMRLAVLSACETGLGELTGGEGVQGLQRAFHLAGCPDVVASLWKVEDAATAALMAQFYRGLWQENKLPIEALREAQLWVYRRPDLVAELAGDRAAPKLTVKVPVRPAEPPTASPPAQPGERTPTKLWAAFVLSGVGR